MCDIVIETCRKTALVLILVVWLLIGYFFSCVIFLRRDYIPSQTTNWVLIGGLTDKEVDVRIRRNELVSKFMVSTTEDILSSVIVTEAVQFNGTSTTASDNDDEELFVQALTVTGLTGGTRYFYATLDENDSILTQGTFQTEHVIGRRGYFKFATSGCAMSGSTSDVFQTIVDEDPDLSFFLHLGDLHYEDINADDLETRIQAFDQIMASPSQRKLYSSMGLVYIWDDHDWLGNDSDGQGPGRKAALESYRQAIPIHGPLPAYNDSTSSTTTSAFDGGVYHAFTISTVRFIISDLRSESSADYIYSERQRDWLFDELAKAADYDYVIWITSKPWIGEAVKDGEKSDDWSGYAKDRQELSDWITLVVPNNLLAISSDAHMLAFDDGSNTYYGMEHDKNVSEPVLSFPLLQSGPLDRLGSFKGGPYSDGCTAYRFERNHQYSTVTFTQSETNRYEACLIIRSYRLEGPPYKRSLVFENYLCGSNIFAPSNPGAGSCEPKYFSNKSYILIGLSGTMLLACITLSCLLGLGTLLATLISLLIIVGYFLLLLLCIYIPILSVKQFNTFETGIIGLCLLLSVAGYLLLWTCFGISDEKGPADRTATTTTTTTTTAVVTTGNEDNAQREEEFVQPNDFQREDETKE